MRRSSSKSPTGSSTSRLRFEYNTPAAGDTTVTDEDGYKRVDHYDNGQRTSVTYGADSPAPVTYSFDYDRGNGRVTGVYSGTGAGRVQLWSYAYDWRGNLRSAIQRSDTAGGDRTTTWGAYNRFDQPTTVTDPVGTVTSFTYDGGGPLTNGNLTQTDVSYDHDANPSTTPVIATTKYGYNALFDLVSVTSPEQVAAGAAGKSWGFGYDAFGQPLQVTDPMNNVSVNAFDALGRPSFQIPPVGTKVAPTNLTATNPYATVYTADVQGRVLTATDANGHRTTWAYNGDGNPTTVTDADAKTVSYAYDAAGRPTCARRGDGSATYTSYTAAGRVSEQADTKATVAGCPMDRAGWGSAVSITSYGWWANGQVKTVTQPAGNVANLAVTSFTYDTQGRLATRATGADSVTYDRFTSGEPKTVTYTGTPGPDVTAINYDKAGRRTTATSGGSTQTWVWDGLGRLLREDPAVSTVGLSYGWNLDGNLKTTTYPNGKSATRRYDAAGRFTELDWDGAVVATFPPDLTADPVAPYRTVGYAGTASAPTGTDRQVFDKASAPPRSPPSRAPPPSVPLPISEVAPTSSPRRPTTAGSPGHHQRRLRRRRTHLLRGARRHPRHVSDVGPRCLRVRPAGNLTVKDGRYQVFDDAHERIPTPPRWRPATTSSTKATYGYDTQGTGPPSPPRTAPSRPPTATTARTGSPPSPNPVRPATPVTTRPWLRPRWPTPRLRPGRHPGQQDQDRCTTIDDVAGHGGGQGAGGRQRGVGGGQLDCGQRDRRRVLDGVVRVGFPTGGVELELRGRPGDFEPGGGAVKSDGTITVSANVATGDPCRSKGWCATASGTNNGAAGGTYFSVAPTQVFDSRTGVGDRGAGGGERDPHGDA
ncbi:MAG: hypothetical protein R2726_16530 [Acidimicrobiales bacterium]